jgi:hypothetical protein
VEDYCLAVYREVELHTRGAIARPGEGSFRLFLGEGKGPGKREGAQIANSHDKHNIHSIRHSHSAMSPWKKVTRGKHSTAKRGSGEWGEWVKIGSGP